MTTRIHPLVNGSGQQRNNHIPFRGKPVSEFQCPRCQKTGSCDMAYPHDTFGEPVASAFCRICGDWITRIENPPKTWKEMTEQERQAFMDNWDHVQKCLDNIRRVEQERYREAPIGGNPRKK